MRNILVKLIKIILIVIIILVLIVVGFLGFLTIIEYNPDDVETVEIIESDSDSKVLNKGDEISILTWNIGYGALGDNADFFMDGGTMVNTADEERLYQNIDDISSIIAAEDTDIVMLQEIDRDSYRSSYVDEVEYVANANSTKNYAFACNFNVLFIPYPIPPIGKVYGGITTYSDFEMSEASRIKLPTSFTWPVRIGNLKRCLLVTRIPVEGTDKELVIVNLHLEAYDDGEGKIAQTKILFDLLNEENEKGNYVIAGGDFNQTFTNIDTSAYEVYEGNWEAGLIVTEGYEDKYQFIMDNSVPSCRSLLEPYATADKDSFQYYVIDGYILSNNIKVESCETLDYDFKSSDHNPVVLKAIIE